MKNVTLFALIAMLISFGQAGQFERIYSFPVNTNLPTDVDQNTETSAEIISATEDGNMLVYGDSPLGAIGMIDITDPNNPQPAGVVMVGGETTAVSVAKEHALVAVNTSASYTEPSGYLLAVRLADKETVATCDLGGQPDSTAVSPDGSIIAIAIENERDEDLDDGVIPQMPAGSLAIFTLDDTGLPDCESAVFADVTGLAEIAGDDPEPEFVDINKNNEIVLTLQENNHIVILAADGTVINHFSAGTVDLENVDTQEERALTFDDKLMGVNREPDAVQWLDNDRFVIANEGDYQGGSRGFTIFNKDGEVLFESGLSFEYKVARAGHYPEKRSGNKGVEPEGLEVKEFDGTNYIFVLSERGSVVGVYKDTGAEPEFVQLLPTALGPEGTIAIPSRNLLAVSNEVDLVEENGLRSHVTLYQYHANSEDVKNIYPMIESVADQGEGRPLGFGALSGLAAHPSEAGMLYAVNDSFYAQQPTIFQIDATQKPAQIIGGIRVTRAGYPAQLLDMEGITSDGEDGFWIASEGRSDRLVPYALYHVDASGEISDYVPFPSELLAVAKRFAAEGVTMIGDTLWIAIQREWKDDPKGMVKLVAYDTKEETWGYVHYQLETPEKGWVGLSEIVAYGDNVYIIERDNQIGLNAQIKRIYKVAQSELEPVALGEEAPVVSKELFYDLLPDIKSFNGYVLDKIEGLAIDVDGEAFVVSDNDGVDDSNGETLFFSIGKVE